MAIAVISDAPGGAEQFEALQQRMNLMANPPAGGLAQLAGAFEGGWRVISVWESEAAWEAFRRDRLEPIFQQAGMPAPQFTIWPLHSMMLAPR